MLTADLTAEDLEALIATVPSDGHLVFCDDSEVGEAEGMEPDVGLMVAIEMTPAAYAAARARLLAYLSPGFPGEFHATDIVGGRKKTPWGGVSPFHRLAAFREISDTLVATEAHLSYVHIAQSQYGDMRDSLAAVGLDPKLGWKPATRRVLVRTLIAEAAESGRPTLVITDQHRPIDSPQIDRSEHAPGLIGGGVFVAPSDQIVGLQLADMAAFCIGRHLRRRSGYVPDALQGFDEVVVNTVAAFVGRSRSLLRPATAGA